MSDFYDEALPVPAPAVRAGQLGPIFTATYETDCESCPEPILPGEDARADGHGSWIHADTMCERVALQ